MRPTVYVPQETMRRLSTGGFVPQHDLTPALEFGVLSIMLDPGAPLVDVRSAVTVMQAKLAGFTDDDYVLATGDPGIFAAAAVVAASRNNGRVKLLRWDRRMGMYICIQIDAVPRKDNDDKQTTRSDGKRRNGVTV